MWARTSHQGDHKGRPIRINLSPNPGFRGGKGGWVDVVWALRLCWRMAVGMRQGEMGRRPQQGEDVDGSATSQHPQTTHVGRP